MDRKIKYYVKKAAEKRNITFGEYYENYYNKDFEGKYKRTGFKKTEDFKTYKKEYYEANKDKWVREKGRYVYFIYVDIPDHESVYYIGSTNDIRARMSYHKSQYIIKELNEKGLDYGVFYLDCGEITAEELLHLEYYFISMYKPNGNKKTMEYDREFVNKFLVGELKFITLEG